MAIRPPVILLIPVFIPVFAALWVAVAAPPEAAPAGVRARIDFRSDLLPVLGERCSPCHFPGGKMYERLPFDQEGTIRVLGTSLFSRLTVESDQALVRAFLEQPQAPAGVPSPPADPLQHLAWMAGTWTGDDRGIRMEEAWLAPRGGTMLGMHRDVKGERTISFEFLRIELHEGEVTYWASPRSAPPTPFRMKAPGTPGRVTFENPGHDFPQRILYWLDSQGMMHARVEGVEGGAPSSMEWSWKKAKD